MPKALWCELCKVQLSSQTLLDVHSSGKRHQKKATERDAWRDLAARSVYISGLNPEVTITKEEIVEALNCFGNVEKVHLDVKNGKYAIVEFDQEFSAVRAIFEDKIRIGCQVVPVRARKVDFEQCQSKLKENKMDIDKIINQISGQKTFVGQVDALFGLYCLTDTQIAERASYAQILTDALGDYFSSGAHVRIFGSSITSIGTKDSDIDASLFFDVPLTGLQCVGDLTRNKYTLLTCDMDALRGRKVCAEEYARLTPADRVRLLNKVVNDIRKRGRAPVAGQYPILDARCPLVRFIVGGKCAMDLSVDNHLGYAKSSWLKGIVQCDSSQLIRRFLVAFRFWAHANDLMRTGETERSHFNAYTLNLLCITYLQLQNYLPPLQRSEKVVFADEWRIDFDIRSVDLSSLSLEKLFKDFFVWFIQLKLLDTILCPHLGCTVTSDQFQALLTDSNARDVFKVAHLNVQDPLEWSHNVSMLVSERHIAAMRRQMMFALSRMKMKSDSFVAALHELRDTDSEAGSSSSSDHPLEIRVGVCGTDQCLEVVHRLFAEVLAFSPAVEPFEKRPRLDDNLQDLCRVYVVKRRTWEGRRNKRRQIIRESPALTDDSVSLEQMVTQQICQALVTQHTGEELSLCFKVYVKQKGAECILEFVQLNGPLVEFTNLIHFLQHFIPANFSCLIAHPVDEPME